MDQRLAELQITLRGVADTLGKLRTALGAQREAVVAADLARLLVLTEAVEVLGAKLASQEKRRQAVQAELETALGVAGLSAIATACRADERLGAELVELVETVGQAVLQARLEADRTTALLHGAAEQATRARTWLSMLAGAAPAYGPTRGHPARPAMAPVATRDGR